MFFQVNSLLALEQHPRHPHPVMGFIYLFIYTHTQKR